MIGFFVIPIIFMLPAKEEENQWGRDPLCGDDHDEGNLDNNKE